MAIAHVGLAGVGGGRLGRPLEALDDELLEADEVLG